MEKIKQRLNIFAKLKGFMLKFARRKKVDPFYSEDKFIGYEAFTSNYHDEYKKQSGKGQM
ncbi:MAG: hypothetical protein IBX72_10630 [Nitrospirae bacterium]|nr:hypothetical protein [Nitrospirota bacterium]